MRRFLLLLSSERTSQAQLGAGEMGRRVQAFREWIAAGRRSGVLRAGALVERRLRGQAGAAGPGSFFVFEADDLEVALALVAGCPGANPGMVELLEM
jgi:hypothetical protein